MIKEYVWYRVKEIVFKKDPFSFDQTTLIYHNVVLLTYLILKTFISHMLQTHYRICSKNLLLEA